MPPDFSDISSFQAGADLAAYARSGADRILIKATEGASYPNPDFAAWWHTAAGLGLARGAYHFARPSQSSGTVEADHFVSVLEAAGGVGPRDWVVLDAEDPRDTAHLGGRHAADFCARMVVHGYPTGLIYTYSSYATDAGLIPPLLPASWRWLHIANYTTTPDASVPLPFGWSRQQVVARQYTSTASQPGIPGQSDRSRVLVDWLPTTGGLVLDDPTAAQVASIVRNVLNEGTAAGQVSWAATEKAILGLEQALINTANVLVAALGWNKGDPSIAGRLDSLTGSTTNLATEIGSVGNYLAAGGPLASWLTQISQQVAAVDTAIRALPVSTSGGADLTPVLAALAALKAQLGSLTLAVVPVVGGTS